MSIVQWTCTGSGTDSEGKRQTIISSIRKVPEPGEKIEDGTASFGRSIRKHAEDMEIENFNITEIRIMTIDSAAPMTS